MAIIDTYKYGSLYVDAAGTISRLVDEEVLVGKKREMLKLFEDSMVQFTFDDEYPWSSYYTTDDIQVPLIHLWSFGGYPGGSLDTANVEAAKEWAEDREYIFLHSTWFGGCELLSMYFVLDHTDDESAVEETIELIEVFSDYPVLDEQLWSEYETIAWENMISEQIADVNVDLDRDDRPVLTKHQEENIRELAQDYFGTWEEGYFPQDTWDSIVDKVVADEVQLHQADKLF